MGSKKILNIDFRYKNPSWEKYSVLIEFSDGSVESHLAINDEYMKAFLSNYTLRPSCYSCQYKGDYTPSDITIGDYWSVKRNFPSFADEKGVSVVFLNNKKGVTFLERCIDNMEVMEVPFEKATQFSLLEPVRCPNNRAEYFASIKEMRLADLNEEYISKKHFSFRFGFLHKRGKKTLIGKTYIRIKHFNENKESCCGCESCRQICPVKAISMEEDNEGFLYPYIDTSKCVSCNLCINHCPIEIAANKKGYSINRRLAYAAKCKDDKVRYISSSGGIFSVLAEHIIKNNGIVYGAALREEDNYLSVKHIHIDYMDDLYKLRKSKYVQSSIGNSFLDIKNMLERDGNRMILFSGTACQIAGLKAFLDHEYENLISIDVICHGVPSPLVFRKYQDELLSFFNNEKSSYF